jgi:hypothetical protein
MCIFINVSGGACYLRLRRHLICGSWNPLKVEAKSLQKGRSLCASLQAGISLCTLNLYSTIINISGMATTKVPSVIFVLVL